MGLTSEIELSTGLAKNRVIHSGIAENINRFEKDGFTGPIKLYDKDVAKEMIREIRLKNLDKSKILYDNNLSYDRHFDISEMRSHICHPVILGYLTGILGPDILLWRTEFFPKFPGTKGTQWHQVRNYSYANGEALIVPTLTDWNAFIDLTVWTTFTPATRENGCMKFLRGSHLKSFYDESLQATTGRDSHYKVSESDAGFFGYDFSQFQVDKHWDPDSEDVVEMEMEAGEAVIFTASCVHGSLPNITQQETRFALSGRYVPTHVRVYPGINQYTAHGETYDVSNFASVLVSGRDQYNHNKIRDADNHGIAFAFDEKFSSKGKVLS